MHFTKIGDGLFETWHKGIRVIARYNKTKGTRIYYFHFPRKKTVVQKSFDITALAKYQTCTFAEPVKAYQVETADMWPWRDSKRAVFKNPSGYKKPFFPKH